MIAFSLKRSFCIQRTLHPSLMNSIRRRGLYPLKGFQEEALRAVQKNQNVFINSCTGSGKTLAYLLPIMNRLYQLQDQNIRNEQAGAIILTLNKELVSQVYGELKEMDFQNRLQIKRAGSLGQIKDTPIQPTSVQTEQSSFNVIVWGKTDIVISTPQALMNSVNTFKGQSKKINPQFLVVDEADLLLELDKNVSRNTDKLIKHIRANSTNSANIKYLLAASSFPKRYKGQDSLQKLKETYKTLVCIEGIDKHKLPSSLQLYYIEMRESEEERLGEQKKMFIKRILSDRKAERIIIFCRQKGSIQQLHHYIAQILKRSAEVFYAELKTEERAKALSAFSSGTSNILICSELGGRGLDFALPVDCIIQFDMAENIVHFINRAGRTARNGLKGQVITFVEEKNKQFFKHLKELKIDNQELDQLFSRKRSYRKLYHIDD